MEDIAPASAPVPFDHKQIDLALFGDLKAFCALFNRYRKRLFTAF